MPGFLERVFAKKWLRNSGVLPDDGKAMNRAQKAALAIAGVLATTALLFPPHVDKKTEYQAAVPRNTAFILSAPTSERETIEIPFGRVEIPHEWVVNRRRLAAEIGMVVLIGIALYTAARADLPTEAWKIPGAFIAGFVVTTCIVAFFFLKTLHHVHPAVRFAAEVSGGGHRPPEGISATDVQREVARRIRELRLSEKREQQVWKWCDDHQTGPFLTLQHGEAIRGESKDPVVVVLFETADRSGTVQTAFRIFYFSGVKLVDVRPPPLYEASGVAR